MIYAEAINLIKKNPFNLGIIDPNIVDIWLVRFTRRYYPGSGAWAVEGYCPKRLKSDTRIWSELETYPEDIPLDSAHK